MKKILKVFLWIFIIFIVLSTGLFILVQNSDKTILNELKNQLNKYLLTEVQINNMHVSSFKNFPNITLILDHVVVKEVPKENNQNLAKLDNIYLVINLFDFLKKNYIIQKVVFSDGIINIKRYQNNSYNYEIWKKYASDSTSSNVNFKINKAIFNNIIFYYTDNIQDISLSTEIKKTELKGNLTSTPYDFIVHSKTKDLKLRVHKQVFEKNELFELKTSLTYDIDKQFFKLYQSKLWIGDDKIEVNGNYIYDIKENSSNFDLILNVKSISCKSLLTYFPNTYKSLIKEYNITGDLGFKVSVKGIYDKSSQPSVKIDFKTNNSEVSNNNYKIKEIKLFGEISNYRNGKSMSYKISLPEFQAIFDDSKFNGSIVIQNIKEPYVNLNLKSKINLISINSFLKKSNYRFDSGYADLELTYKGRILEMNKMTDQDKIEAKISIKDGTISDNSGNKISDLNSDFHVTENKVIINNISTLINQNSFSFSGSVEGLIPYLTGNSLNLDVIGDLTISKYDFTRKRKISSQYKQSFILPALTGLDFDINLKMGEIIFPGFSANQLNGKIQVKNENIIAKNLNFKSLSGSGVITGILSKSPRNEIIFEGQSNLSKIDINKLFVQFKNFGQNNITDKNLKGIADINIQIIISFDSNLKLIQPSLYTLADISITNGELINYQTIQNLFGFIKMKKMNYILFDKIQNTIIIKDRELVIPKMTMKSSVCNFEIQGKHNFDNQMEYNIKVNLTKLFFGKNKVDRTQLENAEDDTKGGINVYVTMYGDGSNPKFKINKSSSISTKVKDGLNIQKTEMKEILKKKHIENKEKQNKDKQNNDNKNDDYELQWDDNQNLN